MSERDAHSALIRDLAMGLEPVKRLRPPAERALLWLGGTALLAAVLYIFPRHLPMSLNDAHGAMIVTAIAASAVTTILAAIAAFQISLPDRSGLWALLPLPAALVWLAASGMGCLENIGIAGMWGGTMMESGECLMTILAISVPLSVALLFMLGRAAPLRPNLVAIVGGLAVAAGASTLLILIHPHNSALLDFAAHIVAVTIVLGANAVWGSHIFVGGKSAAGR
jgi:hypothetical protein